MLLNLGIGGIKFYSFPILALKMLNERLDIRLLRNKNNFIYYSKNNGINLKPISQTGRNP